VSFSSFSAAKEISQTWRDLDDECGFADYGIENGSTIVLTLKDAEAYAEPLNPVDTSNWRFFADDHALAEIPPSAIAARTAPPKRFRHREMMDGKVRT
jgi:hypothetical protein